MRKVLKNPNSKILADGLMYVSGDSNNNKKIATVLLSEQKKICAYTDEYISRTDAKDIEHFDPTLKDTPQDNYNNWFLVKHQWNKEKSYKWENFQPILHPTSNDFEDRIIYINGDYIAKYEHDEEARNLVSLLKLDDAGLADKRKRYISRKLIEIKVFGQDAKTFFSILLTVDPGQISYLRAIKEEFEFDIWAALD